MEATFTQDQLVKNPNQDPMGHDAQLGLERWLDKFHQPGVPSHTIITDPEYSVFLWFHNAIGNLIECPYLHGGYVSRLDEVSGNIDFDRMNKPFYMQPGVSGSADDKALNSKCVDLTPFVREAQLPEIAPANGDKITTLFGDTAAGSFSPYASDGQKPITLSMLDTEYSILDAIFYPWMKDINSPWWYRPDAVYTEWATPYPMATLEVQRPRMRFRKFDGQVKPGESRNDADYVYYSYKFIGVKPTNYAGFELNAGGRSNLLRSLTLICDMCIVDLASDAHISSASSVNFGNRTRLLFDEPESNSGDDEEDAQSEEDELRAQQEAQEELEKQFDDLEAELEENEEDQEQQEQGDLPGEDEPEMVDEEDEDYDSSEYADDFNQQEGENETTMPQDMEEGHDEVDEQPPTDYDFDEYNKFLQENGMDASPPSESPNTPEAQEEKGFFDSVMETISDIGSDIGNGLMQAGGELLQKGGELLSQYAPGLASSAGGMIGGALGTYFGGPLGATVGSYLGTKVGSAVGDIANSDVVRNFLGLSTSTQTTQDVQTQQVAPTQQQVQRVDAVAATTVKSDVTNVLSGVLSYATDAASNALADVASDWVADAASSLFRRDEAPQFSIPAGVVPFARLYDELAAATSEYQVSLLVVSSYMDAIGELNDKPYTVAPGILYAGSMSGEMRPATFSFVFQAADLADHLHGTRIQLDKANDALAVSAIVKQDYHTNTNIQRMCLDIRNVTTSAQQLQNDMPAIGRLAHSVFAASDGVPAQAAGELGKVVARMCTGRGNKPTPTECHVWILSGKDTTGATLI